MERQERRSNVLTELVREIGPDETTIPVLSTAAHRDYGRLDIEGEKIEYTGKTVNTFTGCTRGADLLAGSPATSHPGGAYVFQDVPDEIEAAEGGIVQSVRPNLNFVDTAGVVFTVADDPANNRTNVSAEATGVGSMGPTGPIGPLGPTGPTGPQGVTGRSGVATAWYQYVYSNAITNADPGSGFLRINNGTHFSATEIYIDTFDAFGGNSIGLGQWADTDNPVKGVVRIERVSDPNVYVEYWLTGEIAETGYFRFTVTPLDVSPGFLANNDPVYLIFTRAGEQGPTGPPGTNPLGSEYVVDSLLLWETFSITNFTGTAAVVGNEYVLDLSGVLEMKLAAEQVNAGHTTFRYGLEVDPTPDPGTGYTNIFYTQYLALTDQWETAWTALPEAYRLEGAKVRIIAEGGNSVADPRTDNMILMMKRRVFGEAGPTGPTGPAGGVGGGGGDVSLMEILMLGGM